MVRQWLVALAVVAITAACAAPSSQPGVRSRDVITAEQITDAKLETFDLHTVIQRLRPNWLQPRPAGSARQRTTPVVYRDAVRLGDLSSLQSINALEVAEVRYLDPREASFRYGLGHEGGVILVLSSG